MLVTRNTFSQHNTSELIFVCDHVPKCAGTSLDAYLRTVINPATTATLPTNGIPDSVTPYTLISGHTTWGVHGFDKSRHYAYFSFLRHPASIAQSMYSFSKSLSGHNLTFDEYITQNFVHNRLVRHLGRGSFEAALRKVESTYFFIGFVEHFHPSVATLYDMMGVKPFDAATPVIRKNVSKEKAIFSSELLEYFKHHNAHDYALYAKAKQCHLPIIEKGPSLSESDTGKSNVTYSEQFAQKHHLGSFSSPKINSHDVVDPKEERSFTDIEIAFIAASKINDKDAVIKLYESLGTKFKNMLSLNTLEYLCFTSRDYEAAAHVLNDISQLLNLSGATTGYFGEFRSALEIYGLFLQLKRDNSTPAHESIKRMLKEIDGNALFKGQYPLLLKVAIEFDMKESILALYDSLIDSTGPGSKEMIEQLANHYLTTNEYKRAFRGFSTLKQYDPLDFSVLQSLSIMRRHGQTTHDVTHDLKAFCDAVPGSSFEAQALKEILVTEFALNKEIDFSQQDFTSDHYDQQVSRIVQDNHKTIHFDGVHGTGNSLVIASAPDLLLSWINTFFLATHNGDIDYLIGKNSLPIVTENSNTNATCYFPSHFFLYEKDADTIRENLGNDQYTTVLLLMSKFDLSSYSELIRLARSMTNGPIYVYCFELMMSRRKDIFLVLE